MGQLSATLNPLGWTIPILPEMDDLTVGACAPIITLLLNRKDSITFSIYTTNRRINYGNWY